MELELELERVLELELKMPPEAGAKPSGGLRVGPFYPTGPAPRRVFSQNLSDMGRVPTSSCTAPT